MIRTTIRDNQKCFVLRDPPTAKLVNNFILVANIEASDGGKAIVAGNERVIRARLSDAKFFYETDLKTRLEDRLPKFEQIVFHEKLGTQAERIERIERLAAELAPLVGADVAKAERAAQLCKADLLTEVVGEFPELQGLMGRYYAEAQGEDEAVAHACEDHYRPKGPDDLVPADPVSIAVALADKIDTLVGFWAIDEKPTGSKDPYALRRAALGRDPHGPRERAAPAAAPALWRHFGSVGRDEALAAAIRVLHPLHEQIVELSATDIELAMKLEVLVSEKSSELPVRCWCRRIRISTDARPARLLRRPPQGAAARAGRAPRSGRCRVRARRPGRSAPDRAPRRGARQIPRHRRRQESARRRQARRQHPAHRGEEGRRDATAARPMPSSSSQPEEKALAEADRHRQAARPSAAVAQEDFAAAMTAMAKLRPHVDAFFDKVTVNVDDKAVRANRLKLLNEIREATRAVADFSKIEG